MARFFVERIEHPALLSAEESRHAVRVLRLAVGDRVTVFDAVESWSGEIAALGERVSVRLLERLARPAPRRVVVAAAVPKGARLDWMVEKLAELGVAEFVPVRFARSVAELGDAKRARLAKLAVAAAKQSGAPVMRIGEERAVAALPEDALLADPDATEPLGPGEGWVVVGPEGRLTEAERGRLERRVSLGPTVLRIETAALAAAARRLA